MAAVTSEPSPETRVTILVIHGGYIDSSGCADSHDACALAYSDFPFEELIISADPIFWTFSADLRALNDYICFRVLGLFQLLYRL